MPKIPTFRTEATITGEVGSVKSNIQMGLNQTIGSALAPVTKEVVQHAVKQKDFENKTEALRLENDYIRDMQSVYDQASNLENQDQAQNLIKTESNIRIQKYANLASNRNSKDLFTQYALSEVQKGIFRTSTAVERNTLIALDTLVSEKKSKLLITGIDTKDGFDYDVLSRDLEDLYTINYKGKVSNAVLGKMIAGIPNEIKYLEAEKMVFDNPIEALQMLKDEKDFVGLNYDSRVKLIEKAKTILRPQITTEFETYIKARELGKEPPRFNFELAKEILSKPQAEKMMVAKTLADENADNVKLLHSVSNEDVLIQLEEMKKDNNNKYSINLSTAANNSLEQTVTKILSDREEDPFQYLLETDSDIENKLKELQKIESEGASFSAPNQFSYSLVNQAQQEFTEIVLNKQKELNIKNIKVMTNEASKQFVMDYTEAGNNSNKQKMSDMMASLITSYGDKEGLAIKQLRSDGLTFDAMVSSVLGNSEIGTIGLSFNTPAEKEEIKKYLKGEKIDFEEIKTEVNEGVKDFMNIALGNTPLDSTESLTKTNEIKEFLGFVAAQKMIGNPGMEQSEAVEYAVDTWMNNFVLADTYFINKQQGDKRFNDREIGNYMDKLDIIKKYYLDEMNIVAFKSSNETDPVKLSSRMYSQMLTNGEFRNTEDGEGQIFGIALDGSFAPVINDKGEQIIVSINDKNNFVPGTNITIDYDVAFNDPEENTVESLITAYEKASQLARDKGISYEDALKEIKQPSIPNIKFDDGKKNSKISVDDQSSIFKTIGDSIITPAYGSEMNLTTAKRIILDKVGGDIYNEESQNNLQKFINAVRDVESNSGENTYNESTTAAGDFQFKMFTKDKNGKYTIKKGSAFQTGLQRIKNRYKEENIDIPNWVEEAVKHNDPRKLTYEQQEELFLINLYQQVESDALIKAMLDGDMEKAMQLYAKFHHTKDNVVNDRIVKQKFKKAYK